MHLVTVLGGREEHAWAVEPQNGYESPVLPLPGCVSVGKLLNFCEPQFPHLEIMCTQNGDDNI